MHSKRLDPHELDKVATVTLAHYEQRAEEFVTGRATTQNIDSLLQHIEGEAPFTILDFGRGPGIRMPLHGADIGAHSTQNVFGGQQPSYVTTSSRRSMAASTFRRHCSSCIQRQRCVSIAAADRG